MKASDVFQSFIELCEGPTPTLSALAGGFRNAVETLGFRHFALCSQVDPLNPPPRALMLHNYPPRWVKRVSEERLFAIDPVLQRAEREPEPFFWDMAFPTDTLSEEQQMMMLNAAKHGIAHGFTIPIRLPSFPNALPASCSVVPDNPLIEPRSYFAVVGMAIHLCAAANRVHDAHDAPNPVELSRRERQCILLIAQGRTDAEIASLLGMTRSTAHTYVERLKTRLGVATRTEAVAKAIITGVITVSELTLPPLDARPPGRDPLWTHPRTRH